MIKIGILGGGQLGRMFLQEAINYPTTVSVLDPSEDAPCAILSKNFVVGDFADEKTVIKFGQSVDTIGIEIEHVNVAALKRLQASGKRVIPSPDSLEIIQDKGRQKKFYAKHGIASPKFYLIQGKADLDVDTIFFPFVQKLRTGGYDGRGVQIIENEADLPKLWDAPSVIEAKCDIDKEIAVMVASDGRGEILSYPVFEMVFNAQLNQLDYVKAPAIINPDCTHQAIALAEKTALALGSPGLFAVEFFIDKDQQVWVNETAPRVHNSAHLTIEACATSQFDQMWRILCQQPLGTTQQYCPAAMLNLIGSEGCYGEAELPYLEELLAMDEVFVHWYGKAETRPGRKMGHVTVLAATEEKLAAKIKQVQKYLVVKSKASNISGGL